MHSNRSLCATVVLALATSAAGLAQQYSFRHYGSAEGLQNLAVLSLAQDGAGYLWAGSEAGLYRYDGSRFRLMGPAEGLPCTTEVQPLHVAADGALWVNTCAQLFRFDGLRFQPVAGLSGMLAGAQRIADRPDGRVLIGTSSGVYEAVQDGNSDRFSAHAYRLGPLVDGQPVASILLDGSRVWFDCGQRLCLNQDGRTFAYGTAQGLPEDHWDGIAVTPDGSVWVRSPSKLFKKPARRERFVEETNGLASSMFWGALTVARDGSLMVPTDRGLATWNQDGWKIIDQRAGLRTSMTSAVLEDRGGSLWVGLIGAGVARRLGTGWEAWTRTQGLPSDLIWSIRRARNGALWVGTSQGLAKLDRHAPPRVWTARQGLGGDNVRWLGETSDGSIWALAKPGGLARIDSTGQAHVLGKSDGLICGPLNRGFVDHLDRLWLATNCGVFRNERPAASNHFMRIEQPPEIGYSWSIAEDQKGAIWIASSGGLWRLLDNRWRRYTKADGLLNDPYVITVAPDGALWLRHRFGAGVERVEFSGERLIRSTPAIPIAPTSADVTAFLGFDAAGRLWRGSANGVAVLQGRSWMQFTTEDGLIWNDCDGEAFWGDADGTVWIGTSGGLAHFRTPKGSTLEPLAADPIITDLDISRKPRVARIGFSTLSFQSEQLVGFAYRLDSGPWTETRERNISVVGLSPGRHRVEIESRVRNGPFSPQKALAEFQVQPMWWETWWLRSSAVLLALAALWGLILWRHRVLLQHNRELEDAVRKRTVELESERAKVLEEKKRADQANEARGLFLAQMSHEIRTPLGGMIGLTRLLEDMQDPAETASTVRLLRSSSDSLLRVINDILDFSKIDAGKLDLEIAPFRLRECLEDCARLFQAKAEEKGLQLVCNLAPELPSWAAGDEMRLRQVVLNLLSNAVKFTSSGEVRLSVAVERQDEISHSISIEVRDSGIGIKPDDMTHLFATFAQADASISRRYGGTGLGLVICKRLIELMGGTIRAESQPGKGTSFRFTVQLAVAEEQTQASGPAIPPLAGNLKVLVAEDNAVNQRVAIKLLEKLGVKADLATNGRQAVEAALEHAYDLILMDVQMPEVDGLEASRQILQRVPAERQPAIYGLSAHATNEHREFCRQAGMTGYLTKPIDVDKLRDLVAELSASLAGRTGALR